MPSFWNCLMRRIMCLFLLYLATTRVQRDVASAADLQRPLVLTRQHGSTQLVTHACPAAAAAGVRSGMSAAQAQALEPRLLVQPEAPQNDRALLRQLADWALRFSPLVQPTEPDLLLVDVTGCARLFGGEKPLARQAHAGLAALGFDARVVIADTIGAACALATAGHDPLVVVPPEHNSAYLCPLPPGALRIDPATSAQLAALGIRSIGDLLMLPRNTLPARFGPHLVERLQQALGERHESLNPHQPPEIPRATRCFEYPLSDPPTICALAEELLHDLLDQVVRSGKALRRLECALTCEEIPPRVLRVRLARGSRTLGHIAPLLVQRLEQCDLTMGLTGLTLIVREASFYRGRQDSLFEPPEPGTEEQLGALVDRLVGQLGHDAVVRPQVVDDHQPERAFRWVTVAEVGCEPEPDAPRWGNSPRPTRLLPRPILIPVIALLPDGPPTWFSYAGRDQRIVNADGPERIETAWWRGPDVRRDYFRVTTENGEQYWLFRASDDGRWYLHGIFA